MAHVSHIAARLLRKATLTPKFTSTTYTNTYNSDCAPALQQCQSSGSNSDCENSDNVCYNDIEGPLSQSADFDVYDIREPSNDPNPPETYMTYLQTSSIQTKIGAKTKYQGNPPARSVKPFGRLTLPRVS